MRKTYKPIARTEKASQIFRKKTLTVADNLNINHDDNDIEDVDEYWAAAASVIGNQSTDALDDTVITEQSETLFNINTIRKSIKEETQKESIKKEIESEKVVKEETKQIVNLKEQESVNNENKENVSVKKRLTLKPGDDESNEPSETKLLVKEENKKELESSKIEISSSSQQQNNDFSIDSEPIEDNLFESSSDQKLSVNKLSNSQLTVETKENISNNSKQEKTKMLKYRKISKKTQTQENSSIHIQSIKKVEKVNQIKPLVCIDTINTALMTLDFMAYIKETKTPNSFSLFVTKGKIDIKVNGTQKCMKNGEATVLEKGDVYSIKCISANGASLFLSYIL